jgi:antitoxin MazE
MKTKLQKWGHSLAVRIPKSFISTINVKEHDNVELIVEDDQLIIKPLKHKYDIDELVSKINSDNLHNEIKTGSPIGNEIW